MTGASKNSAGAAADEETSNITSLQSLQQYDYNLVSSSL